MAENPRAAYFDAISGKWDGWQDLSRLERDLGTGLEEMGVGPDETVLDVGCGTGNLSRALLARLSGEGRVLGVDISPGMIELARRKVADARAAFRLADASRLPFPDASCDRAVCFSVWPHIEGKEGAARELLRVLRPGGRLHVWHLGSRARVNEIHAGAGEAVRQDLLPPVRDTAALLSGAGFTIEDACEDDSRYLVTAVRPVAGPASRRGRA
jgi:ubiquinone/menaquinone biosynthesis C-methylase UbiE